jgi:trk system potassium uptake protein TrkH
LRIILSWWRSISPPGLFVSSFLLLIAIGTVGLRLVPAFYAGPRFGTVDALFTITSAVCVTGLNVVDPATYFTFWGQLWILLFIQLGGLGLISLTTLIIAALGRRLSLRSEMIQLPGAATGDTRHDARRLTVAAIRFTLVIEGAGALLLFPGFLPGHSVGAAAWHAIFHAISAFCNAGFSTFSTSLMGYAGSPWILFVISLLIILGGVGYLTTEELIRWWRAGGLRSRRRLSTHTFAALVTSAGLLVVGMIFFAVFEWGGTLSKMGFVDRIVNAWFLSVTPRTAGFNSIGYAEIGNGAAFLTLGLMIIGGSPGSTAGGLKTTSFAILVALGIARVRGRRHVDLHDRTVPEATIEKTVSLFLIGGLVVAVGAFLLNVTETSGLDLAHRRASVLPILFETISAFGTVGLSMDLTPTLSTPGRLVVIVLMFLGRVGPLVFFAAISVKQTGLPSGMRAAREDVIVG